MEAHFVPPRWLRSAHVQTIAGTVPFYAPPRTYRLPEEEDLRIPLEEERALLHARAWWARDRAPAVVLLHGIAGSKESLCCVRAAVALHRAGYHAIRLDMRAAGDSVVDAPSIYHGGLTTDLERTVRFIAEHPRVDGVMVLGFSGGGSIALKLAGEWAGAAPAGLRAIASISAPLDYVHVARHMDLLRTYAYRRHVLGGLLDRARAFATQHRQKAHYDPKDLDGIKTFRAYDNAVIVPMYGFDSVDHYRRAASSGPYLSKVAVPALVLHAEDDPMVPFVSVEPWLGSGSKDVRFKLTKHGGHIGWVGGLGEASWIDSWPTRSVLDFFAEHRR